MFLAELARERCTPEAAQSGGIGHHVAIEELKPQEIRNHMHEGPFAMKPSHSHSAAHPKQCQLGDFSVVDTLADRAGAPGPVTPVVAALRARDVNL